MAAFALAWAVVVVVWLGENNRLLKRIAQDIAALRRVTEEERATERITKDIAALRRATEEESGTER